MSIPRTHANMVAPLLFLACCSTLNAAPVAEKAGPDLFQNAPHIVMQMEQTEEDKQEDRRAATREAIIAWGTVGLAAVTLFLWLATAKLAREASQSAERQLAIAGESAKAMAQVAEATRNNSTLLSGMLAKQLRAFLSVNMGGAVAQGGTLKFEGIISVENAGLTPARNVGYWLVARVMNPSNPDLSKPANIATRQNDMTLNPRSSFNISAVVDDVFSEDAVKEICAGVTKRLFLWGEIFYEDEYGGSRVSKFCHTYIFFADSNGTIQHRSYYHQTHNAST